MCGSQVYPLDKLTVTDHLECTVTAGHFRYSSVIRTYMKRLSGLAHHVTDHNIVAARTHSWEARPTVLVDRPAALQPAVSFDMIQHKKYERGRTPVRIKENVRVPQGKVTQTSKARKGCTSTARESTDRIEDAFPCGSQNC